MNLEEIKALAEKARQRPEKEAEAAGLQRNRCPF